MAPALSVPGRASDGATVASTVAVWPKTSQTSRQRKERYKTERTEAIQKTIHPSQSSPSPAFTVSMEVLKWTTSGAQNVRHIVHAAV